MDDLEARSRCRVCGWRYSRPVWDPEEGATYDICFSCGCEAGHEDFTLESTRAYRQKWIAKGMKWDDRDEMPPSGWNPREQMKYIPPGWL